MRLFKRHKHKWVEADRRHMYWQPFLLPEGTRASEFTQITERCADQSCRKWNQIRLDGHLPLTTPLGKRKD